MRTNVTMDVQKVKLPRQLYNRIPKLWLKKLFPQGVMLCRNTVQETKQVFSAVDK